MFMGVPISQSASATCSDCNQRIDGWTKPPGAKLQAQYPRLCGACLGERWREEGKTDAEIIALAADSVGLTAADVERVYLANQNHPVIPETDRRHGIRAARSN
jgi:hypothetical protein